MLTRLCSVLLFKVMGWKTDVTIPRGDKYVIALAPHTSNFDFIVGLLYSRACGFKCDFLMKKEWFFWPLGILMRKLGGIPVFRQRNTSMEKRVLLYRPESGNSHPALRSGLPHKDHPVHQTDCSGRQLRPPDEGNQDLF